MGKDEHVLYLGIYAYANTYMHRTTIGEQRDCEFEGEQGRIYGRA